MKKITIKLTKKQVQLISEGKGDMGDFGLIAQPLIIAEEMKVLILTPNEFKKADRFFKTFIPKKLVGYQ